MPSRFSILAVAAFAVRGLFIVLEPATSPIADERTWINWATACPDGIACPRVAFSPFRTALIFYPPLYPYFIAVLHSAFGSLTAVKLVQAGVGALLVPAVGRVGLRAFGPRAGLAAAAVTAFYPELIWFSAHFWSETLFMTLLWWGFERLLTTDQSGARGTAALAGLLFGLSILTRETVLFFAPLAGLWLAGRAGAGRVQRGALFILTTLLLVAPWTLRNAVVFQAFVPVSTAGGLNLWQGNARLTRQEVYDRYYASPGPIQQYRNAQRMGIASILERQPLWFFEKMRDEMPQFWEANNQALDHVRREAYGPATRGAVMAAAAVTIVPYLAVLALFVWGLTSLPLDRSRLLLLGFLVYYNLIHVVTHGFARYRLPAMPVLFLWAAAAWAHRRAPSVGPLDRTDSASIA